MIALIPVLFAIVGVLLYVLATSGKLSEIGRIVFACAFLALMISMAGHTVKFF